MVHHHLFVSLHLEAPQDLSTASLHHLWRPHIDGDFYTLACSCAAMINANVLQINIGMYIREGLKDEFEQTSALT